MPIHNDSLVRVVQFARAAGALLAAGGSFLALVAIVSVVRDPSGDTPWTRLVAASLGILPGIALLVCASMLDRGRIRAFYAIAAIAAAEVMLAATAVLISMSYRAIVLLPPMLGLAAACGTAWHPAQSIRRRKPYVPPTPIASTAVVIPPPPARKKDSAPPLDVGPLSIMAIEIRRA